MRALLTAIMLLTASCASAEQFPGLTVSDADGNPHALTELLHPDEPTLVNFWAGWCPPCREELPLLLAGHLAGQYRLIAINLGDSRGYVNEYLTEHGIGQLPNYFLGVRQAAGLPIPGMPTSLALDGTGKVLKSHYGAFNQESLDAFLTDWSEQQ